ncbi:MAG: glycosyltransferase family 4 protein [Pseudomonadota bacterium]
MNIAILTPAWPAGAAPNGIATYYDNLVPAMAALGHKIIVLTAMRNSGDNNDTDNIHVYELPKKLGRLSYWRMRIGETFEPGHLSKAYGAAQIIEALELAQREHQIDLLQMEESFGWHQGVRERFDFPVVARLHGPHFLNASKDMGGAQSSEDNYRVKGEGEALSKAIAVTAPSNDVMLHTKNFYNLEWDHAAVFPNPVRVDEAQPQWSLDGCDRNEILFVGRFDRHKGGDILLEAFIAVAEARPEVRLVFAGPDRGIVDETGERRQIEFFLQEMSQDVRERVKFLGQLSRSEIKALRTKAFVTVVSSRYETFGNVVIEAMACGCPVVATNTGGIAEIIDAEETGALVPAGDASALANRLIQAFDSLKETAAMGAKAYEVVRERFDPERIARDHLRFFQQVISSQEQ